MTLRHLLKVTENNRESVADALMELAMQDADFCGDNGSDYMWTVADGYECNAEYVLSVVEKESTTTKMIEKFYDMWMGNDLYYADYSVRVEESNGMLVISVVYVTEY